MNDWLTRASPASATPMPLISAVTRSARASPMPPMVTETSLAAACAMPPIRTSTWAASTPPLVMLMTSGRVSLIAVTAVGAVGRAAGADVVAAREAVAVGWDAGLGVGLALGFTAEAGA